MSVLGYQTNNIIRTLESVQQELKWYVRPCDVYAHIIHLALLGISISA